MFVVDQRLLRQTDDIRFHPVSDGAILHSPLYFGSRRCVSHGAARAPSPLIPAHVPSSVHAVYTPPACVVLCASDPLASCLTHDTALARPSP